MSNAQEVGFSPLQIKPWQPEVKPEIPPQSQPQTPVSKSAVQERQGVSNDLQKFLLVNSLKFPTFPTPKDVHSKTPPLFSKGSGDKGDVDLNDIKQGNYGDCYLLASVAAIAKSDPQKIHDMVKENRDANGNVTSYTVTFYKKDGGFLGTGIGADYHKVQVQVKPSEIFKDGANPADNGEIWVKVIETGYAKFKGGVDNIKNGGYPQDALQDLTGKDSHTVDPQNIFSQLVYPAEAMQSDLNSGKNIVLSSKDDDKTYNVHGGHAYTVQSVYTDSNGNKMVQLNNPWGFDQPKPIPYSELGKYFHTISIN